MTAQRGPRPGLIILDEFQHCTTVLMSRHASEEAQENAALLGQAAEGARRHRLTPLATVNVSDVGIKRVVFDWAGVEWPRQSGKRALTKEFTLEGSLSETARLFVEPLFAEILARRTRTVHRLAHELGLDVATARRQFDEVQHVLEATGVGDGYGLLTIPQPVRPPVVAPSGR